jgi:hypothetical protein
VLGDGRFRVQHAVGNTFISCEIKDVGFWQILLQKSVEGFREQ